MPLNNSGLGPRFGSASARIRSAPSTGALFIAPCLRPRYVGFKRKTALPEAEGDMRGVMMGKTRGRRRV